MKVKLLCVLAVSLLASAAARPSADGLHCDWSTEKRGVVTERALEILASGGIRRVERGALLYKNKQKPGEQIEGNPNTVYGILTFPRRDALIPHDYPTGSFSPPGNGSSSVPSSLQGFSMQRQEAVVLLLCMPPPVRYFGITTYVTQRLLSNQSEWGHGDAGVLQHNALAEVSTALNYININTTEGRGSSERRKRDPSPVFGSTALLVFTSSNAMYEHVASAFVAAGLPEHATNFYPISAQSVRLHDRSKPWDYDYPDLVSMISRASYFLNATDGQSWTSEHWPAFFLRGPSDQPDYQRSVPDQLMTPDQTGDDSELRLLPTLQRVIQAVIANKTANVAASLVRVEQLAVVPNDWRQREQCLNNASFVAAINPLMMAGGCGFGTRDCRYGTSPSLDMPFGERRFFVVVGVRHEALQHCSYSSLMFTSQTGYEQGAHTITFRETDGEGAPRAFMPPDEQDQDDLDSLFAVTLSRECDAGDVWCLPFTTEQFKPEDIVYWMERAYLQRSTGVGPSDKEYVTSFVLTFDRPGPASARAAVSVRQQQPRLRARGDDSFEDSALRSAER